jgi:hypothetical protein
MVSSASLAALTLGGPVIRNDAAACSFGRYHSVSHDSQQPGFRELAANEVAREKIVVAGAIRQPVDVDLAALVAWECQCSPFLNQGREAQLESGGRLQEAYGAVHGDRSD